MYQIKDFTFQIHNHHHIKIPLNMNQFQSQQDPYYHYDIYLTKQIEVPRIRFDFNKETIKIIKNGDLETRYLYIHGDQRPYALCVEIDKTHSLIYIHQDYQQYMDIDTMFISLLSLERRIQQYHHYILHCSYMIKDNKAILFSAPSGTGKSTQASLWEKYRQARVINGDKCLISKEEDYFANGWPICGSSEICFNESYPLLCIVVLSQGKENKIEKLSYKEAFKKILSELTINYHNSQYVNEAMNFIDDLLLHIPIYHLTCDISENAVICLENQLKQDHLL